MILVCGGLADGVTELVCARLADCDYPYRLLDLGLFPAGHQVHWEWRHGVAPEGHVAGPDWRVDLSELTGVYARYLGAEGRVPPGPGELAEPHATALFVEYDTAIMAVLEHLPCAVVNRIAGGVSNHSKPYQALLIRHFGLRTPPTLVTSDPEAVRRFRAECGGEVIYKSLSGIRSIVRRLSDEQLARLPLLRHAPAQFQGFVPGENVRAHVVGGDVIATRLCTDAVDYRYARREGHALEMEAVALPPAIAAACVRLTWHLGLLFAGLDLKVTPDGAYYCFEINPSPGFSFYEQGSGQPISLALAELLRRGAPAGWPDPARVAVADGGTPATLPA